MNNKMNNIIHYARVSTNSVEQIGSLQNQINMLKTENNCVLVSEVASASKGMTSTIKNKILENQNPKPHIIVTAIDRLSRDIADINFIRQHVEKITTLHDNVTYEVKKDWQKIVPYLVSAVDEIDKIKERFASTKHIKRKKSTIQELIINAKQRVLSIDKIICSTIPKTKNQTFYHELIAKIGEMIQTMQYLETSRDWNNISTISNKYGGFKISNDYNIDRYIENKYEDGCGFHILKNDITMYVCRIFNKHSIELDKYLIKEYINSHINYGKRLLLNDDSDIPTDDYVDTDDIDKITQALLTISLNKNTQKLLNKNEILQIENIAKKIKQSVIFDDNTSDLDERMVTKKYKVE